jgi:hypothetical protein
MGIEVRWIAFDETHGYKVSDFLYTLSSEPMTRDNPPRGSHAHLASGVYDLLAQGYNYICVFWNHVTL